MMRILLILGFLLASLGAQAQGVPTTIYPSPQGRETVTISGVGVSLLQVYTGQLRDARGYAKLTPLTNTTYATPNGVSLIQATPAAGISVWTVTTPLAPVDGQTLQIFTTQTVSTFNLTAAAGQTVNGNLAGSLSANTGVAYVYSASNLTWDRYQ